MTSVAPSSYFRYSLATLLGITTLVAALAAIYGSVLQQAARERVILSSLNQSKAIVESSSILPAFIADLLPESIGDQFVRIRSVSLLVANLSQTECPEKPNIQELADLCWLSEVFIGGEWLSDNDAATLSRCTQLEVIGIDYRAASESTSGLEALCQLPRLRRIEIFSFPGSRGIVHAICRSKSVEHVVIHGSCHEGELSEIETLQSLKSLSVSNVTMGNRDFASLSRHPALERLEFRDAFGITLQGLVQLESLKRLRIFVIEDVSISLKALAALSSPEYARFAGRALSKDELIALAVLAGRDGSASNDPAGTQQL